MSLSKASLKRRDERIKQAAKLIDQHGQLSCASVANIMGINSHSALHTLRWLVKAGTHVRVTTEFKDDCSNLIVVYTRPGGEVLVPKNVVVRKDTQADRARRLFIEEGKTELITTDWLAEKFGIAVPQASAILLGLYKAKEIELQMQTITGGRKKNHYRTTSMLKVSRDETCEISAMQSINEAMAGWHPGAVKRYELRGTA